MERVVIGQTIDDQKAISYYNLLNNFNLGFTLFAVYLLSLFGILTFAFLINQLTSQVQTRTDLSRRTIKIHKRIVSTMSSFGVKRFTSIGVFVLFVYLFLLMTQLFLTSNLKTNRVVRTVRVEHHGQSKPTKRSKAFSVTQVVDTSQLILDEQDILSTRKVACMLENEQVKNKTD